ncbi:hydroxymethylglutaryl-CoA lyase [Sneathiella chinensis]|uniref:hydroxymethylglutaryl-CoA lyase n=1 Tax=Sneathiella chinensis TaxID=349750 RepID=UPI001469F3F7
MERVRAVYPEGRISLREVGLRDGLQMVKSFPSTEGKKTWIEREYNAGVRHFEVGSFLPKDRYPAFADVEQIIEFVATLPGAHASALVLNKRGALNALDTGIEEIGCVVSASEEHNRANVNRTRAETLNEIAELCSLRDQSAHKPVVSVGVAMSYGCSISGAVDPKEVLAVARECYAIGVDVVSIADTVGYAGPRQVAALTRQVVALADGRPVGAHLHDTRGLGLANAAAALDAGATIIDGAMGGLGGCPFAPNATGNVVFEDLVFMCKTNGLDIDIDVKSLIEMREVLSCEMPTETLYGALAKAGLPLTQHVNTDVSDSGNDLV